jgi:hypothetical protein
MYLKSIMVHFIAITLAQNKDDTILQQLQGICLVTKLKRTFRLKRVGSKMGKLERRIDYSGDFTLQADKGAV